MAARGGRGGSPEAFGAGSGEGANKGSKSFDYAGEWKGKRPSLQNQPMIPSSTDAEGLDKGNSAEVEHQTKRFNAWNAAYEAQKTREKAASQGLEKANPVVKAVKPPKNPTNRTTGVHVPQTMGIKEFGQKVSELHSILDSHVNTLRSVKLRPEADAQVGVASGHLGDAAFHIGEAEKARRGVIIGGKRYSGDAEAGRHYLAAVASIRKAHNSLDNEHVSTATQLHNLTAELPSEHLKSLEGAAKTIPVLKGGGAFKSIPFGGMDINPKTIDVKEAEKLVGKGTTAVEKIKAGQRGTARQDKFRVLTGQEDKSLGGLPGADVRTPGRKGAVGTPINPKRRASKTRSVNTSVPSADMSRYQTPKFDATSKIQGEK